MWTIALYMPGEEEIALLSRLGPTSGTRAVGVVDPSGMALGTPLTEALGWPIHLSFQAAKLPADTILVGPANLMTSDSPLAEERSRFRSMSTPEFLSLLEKPAPPSVPKASAAATVETPVNPAAGLKVRRTLDRIDEALDRDALMPWLLSLSLETTDAQGGSVMLFDQTCDELFIVVAKGLQTRTIHTTRLGLGESIAGRVARTRCAELVLTTPGDPGRDRHDIVSAMSAPLIWGDDLLGVVNVNRDVGGAPYTEMDLQDFGDVARRIGRILSRSEGVARTREGSIRHRLTHHLATLSEDAESLESALAGWAGAITLDLEAQNASLAVVRDDGSLLVAEGDATGETRVGSMAQNHPAWDHVLQTRRRVVARQVSQDDEEEELTLFFLPIGTPSLLAILGMTFQGHAQAHRFQGRANAVVDLLQGRLPSLLERFRRQDQLSRQDELAGYLASIDFESSTAANRIAAFRVALARIVGGRHAAILQHGRLLAGVAYLPPDVAPEDWENHASRLLAEVSHGQWMNTTLSPGRSDDPDASLLVIPSPGSDRTGLVLIGKNRHYEGDSAGFNSFDAELALRFSKVLPRLFANERVSTAENRQPEAEPGAVGMVQGLASQLRREMDRSDRYHVAFSLSAFRLPPEISNDAVLDLVESLRPRLRSSDSFTILPDGVTVILAPEETNAVSHLETRIVELMRELLQRPRLSVQHGRAIYPGPFSTPDEMISHALGKLNDS